MILPQTLDFCHLTKCGEDLNKDDRVKTVQRICFFLQQRAFASIPCLLLDLFFFPQQKGENISF